MDPHPSLHPLPSFLSDESIFRRLVDAVTDYAIFALDTTGTILTWNTGAQKLKGYAPADVIGTNFSRFYLEADIQRDHPKHELILAVQNGKYEEEGWRLRKDGSRFWANVVITPIYDESGKHWGFSKITRDFSERKAYVDARILEAQNAVKVRDEFLSIASHELKTPLTSLKLRLQFRKRQMDKGLLMKDFSQMIEEDERQINRLVRLVDDMLDTARLTTGKLNLKKECFDLSNFIKDTIARNEGQILASGSNVIFESTGPIFGEWDPLRIEQSFNNLFSNALKYGQGKPITVRLQEENAHAILSVSDRGPGIDEKDQLRIFKQFERAISANEVSGLGLGLYIVNQLVNSHGGTVSVKSEPGVGSQFIITLPLTSPLP